MKNLVLIIPAYVEQELADCLRSMEHVTAFTLCKVEGHGEQQDSDPQLTVRDKVVGYSPRVRVDVLLADAVVDAVINGLCIKAEGVAGRGSYWVIDVHAHGTL